jgi:hypothetical protein
MLKAAGRQIRKERKGKTRPRRMDGIKSGPKNVGVKNGSEKLR